jgi:hypothetical protein
MFLGLPDPDSDPLVGGVDPDPARAKMSWIPNTGEKYTCLSYSSVHWVFTERAIHDTLILLIVL